MLTGKELAIAVADKLGELNGYTGWADVEYDREQYLKRAAADLLPEYAERVTKKLDTDFYRVWKEEGHTNPCWVSGMVLAWWSSYTHENFLNVWLELEKTDG